MTISKTSEYKNQLFIDVYEGRLPKRVPEKLGVQASAVLQHFSYDLRTAQYGTTKLFDAIDRMNAEFDTDNLIGSWPGTPYWHKILGGLTREMSDSGFIQHKNVAFMQEDEYDLLIDNPLEFLWKNVFPRVYTELSLPSPYNAIALVKSMKVKNHMNTVIGGEFKRIAEKYDKVTADFTKLDNGWVALDYLGDFLRSFTGIALDIRRQPEKVLAALDMLTNIFLSEKFIPSLQKVDRTKRAFCAPHMGTFLKPKDFEKFWWPNFSGLMWARYNAGYHCNIFCEDNWMPYLDFLYELPPGCELQFEKGDPKVIKEKLGKRHIISGLYDCTLLMNVSKEEVVDKAKELIDILAPGGNYIFNFDKAILTNNGVNWDSYAALIDCVHTYGKY